MTNKMGVSMMNYREISKTKDSLSLLGFGCMRFPMKNGKVLDDEVEKMVLEAIRQGVNYFDTAYLYQNGKNEMALGKVLKNGLREKVKIATKLPPLLVHSQKDMVQIFETQRKRLQTDYIDYYLVHALNDAKGFLRLKDLGIVEFFEERKKSGQILNIGFSYHGERNDFKELVDIYPWDFCQIQYNFLDENFQAGKDGLLYAHEKGLGVVVMEPLRGGALVGKMPPSIEAIWDGAKEKRTPAEWAFRWIFQHQEVTTVLSGMKTMEDLTENIKVASLKEGTFLTNDEWGLYGQVKREFERLMKVPCTGCGYCLPCPVGVDIPTCFSYYNTKHFFQNQHINFQYMIFTSGLTGGGGASKASLCIACGKCEKHCPQKIKIPEQLKAVTKDMEKQPMKTVVSLYLTYMNVRKKIRKAFIKEG
jgi:uncharacterized protein